MTYTRQVKGWRRLGATWLGALAALTLLLAACAPDSPSGLGPFPSGGIEASEAEAIGEAAALHGGPMALVIPLGTRSDVQGAVEMAVTPQGSLFADTGTIVFEVAMNTHSVDLSMDLAQRATLETDTGLILPAAVWSGGSGHHVTGYLEFELPQGGEYDQLARANRWSLRLRGVDAEERLFEWIREQGL